MNLSVSITMSLIVFAIHNISFELKIFLDIAARDPKFKSFLLS